MKLLQFWVLMVCSIAVSFLYVRQIFVTRAIDHLQRHVIDRQEAIVAGQNYEHAWNELARSIYINGRGDAAFLDILTRERIEIRAGAQPFAAPAPTTAPSSVAPVSTPPPLTIPPLTAPAEHETTP